MASAHLALGDLHLLEPYCELSVGGPLMTRVEPLMLGAGSGST